MVVKEAEASPQISEILSRARHLTLVERLLLAKLLLDDVLASDLSDEANWSAMGLEAFQRDWDNPEDAIYDNWRELYDLPAR